MAENLLYNRKKPCTRCLLSEEFQQEEYDKVKKYIAAFSEEDKVSDDVYQKRLALCQECQWLYQGICRKCGCYVEIRALRATGYCPHEKPSW